MTSSLESSLDLAVAISYLESCSRTQVADELLSLGAIYDSSLTGDDDHVGRSQYGALSVVSGTDSNDNNERSDQALRLVLTTTLPASTSNETDDKLSMLITIPSTYPESDPPLLQLKSMYLSSFSVSDKLWSAVLRTFMHEGGGASGDDAGVEFVPGQECLFQGIEYARETCQRWVDEQKQTAHDREVDRAASNPVYQIAFTSSHGQQSSQDSKLDSDDVSDRQNQHRTQPEWRSSNGHSDEVVECPAIVSTEPLVERKSVFVGHAARVRSLTEVQAVMTRLLSDKKIARATHNISAFRFTTRDGISHADNDDDGESAAGGRLAHLLTLAHATDVLVVVTRWYGGVHLGPQRFQLINQAGRAALELGGFLPEDKVSGGTKSKSRR
ncbi:hypothetical protein ACM66B_002479 [Microbotryomycetes sp. NB124-2]